MDYFLIYLFIGFLCYLTYEITKNCCGNIISKLFFLTFSIYWLFCLFISTFNPNGLYPVSLEVYLMLILSVLSFFIGFSIIKDKNYNIVYQQKTISKFNQSIKNISINKVYYLCLILGFLLCYNIYQTYYTIILTETVRGDAVEKVMEEVGQNQSSIVSLFYNLVIPPLAFLTIVLIPFFIKCKTSKLILIPASLFIFFYTTMTGGRSSLMLIAIGILFSFVVIKWLFKTSIHIPKFVYVIITIVFIGTYMMMAYMSAIRAGKYDFNWENLLFGMGYFNESFVNYSLLPFRAFDYSIQKDYFSKFDNNFGLYGLPGFNRYLSMIFKRFGFELTCSDDTLRNYLQDTWITVGVDQTANYAYTYCIYFYLDCKILGLIIYPFLFGWFSHFSIKKFVERPTIAGLLLLFYLYYVVVQSVFTWHLNKGYSLGLIIICSILAFKKRRVSIRSTQQTKGLINPCKA